MATATTAVAHIRPLSADFCTSAALALALCLVLPALLYICVLYVHLYVLYRPCYLGPLLRPLGGPPCVLGRCTFVSVANVTHFLLIVDLQRPSLVLFHFGIIVMPLDLSGWRSYSLTYLVRVTNYVRPLRVCILSRAMCVSDIVPLTADVFLTITRVLYCHCT